MIIKFRLVLSIILSISTLSSAAIKIMPLGDSLTYDNTHADGGPEGRPSSKRTAYRSHLWYMLENENYGADFVGSVIAGEDIIPAFDPENEGHPGYDTYDLAEETYSYMTTSNPDIVLLHIGTNDHSSNANGVIDILNEIDAYEINSGISVKVYVALIVDRQLPDHKIVGFNSNLEDIIYQRILQNDNLVLVDMYHDAQLTSADYIENTHPNANGYKKMATVWFNALNTPYTAKLHAYPYSIVSKANIESVIVNEETQNVIFTCSIPNTGITF